MRESSLRSIKTNPYVFVTSLALSLSREHFADKTGTRTCGGTTTRRVARSTEEPFLSDCRFHAAPFHGRHDRQLHLFAGIFHGCHRHHAWPTSLHVTVIMTGTPQHGGLRLCRRTCQLQVPRIDGARRTRALVSCACAELFLYRAFRSRPTNKDHGHHQLRQHRRFDAHFMVVPVTATLPRPCRRPALA